MKQTFGEISKDVISFVQETPAFQAWPECRDLLVNIIPGDDPWIHALPVLSCKATGGEHSISIPITAAWITLVHAANIIDDIQDGDLHCLSNLQSPQLAMTVAIAWIFTAFRMIDHPSYDSETRNKITRIFSSAGFDSSMGQFQDLVKDTSKSDYTYQLEEYWNAVIMKSGSIFKAGTVAGAIVGAGSEDIVEVLGDYGTALGVIRQVMDDCRDVWNDEKISKKHPTLPMLLQSMISDKRFTGHQNNTIKGKKEAEPTSHTPQLLVDVGLPEIVTDILFEWRKRALESLNAIKPSEARNMLEKIVDQAMTPKMPIV
jgi:geranylgeranyl pyrophosphate synthase